MKNTNEVTWLRCEHRAWRNNALVYSILPALLTGLCISTPDLRYPAGVALGMVLGMWHNVLWAWLTRKHNRPIDDEPVAETHFLWFAAPWCDGDRGMQLKTKAQWNDTNFARQALLTMLPDDEWELETSRGTLITKTAGPDHIKQAKAWAEGHLRHWPIYFDEINFFTSSQPPKACTLERIKQRLTSRFRSLTPED